MYHLKTNLTFFDGKPKYFLQWSFVNVGNL